MNNIIGQRTLPCGHHRIRLPDTPGVHHKLCRTCRTSYILTIGWSPDLTAKCGTPVMRANWSKPLQPERPTSETDDARGATLRKGGGRAATNSIGPLSQSNGGTRA